MKAERWRQISRLYHAALACEGDRTAFLKQACADDEELRRDVESMLAHQASAEAFLTPPAWRMTNIASDSQPGDRIGEQQTRAAALKEGLADRYRIDGELGRGGMATVYLADDLKHGRKVAIKTLHGELAATIGHERFLREIEIAARLTHPHILPLHDSGEVNGQLYYVMPYIEGESLRVRLDHEKSLSIEDSLRLAREIASALAYAHQHGVVHRDIKPGNVLLAEGIALIADFGIARAVNASVDQQTATGIIVGTPVYMSPEQASGSGEVDARSDIYSLGCVLYEMLAGEPPFTGSSAMAVLAQHAHEEIPPLKTRRSGITEGLERVVQKSLAKSPADRYPTAAGFAQALSEATVHPFSPQRPGSACVPNNLPTERTCFIGRETELAECARLMAQARLLTVTGIGGSGKTRQALRLAETLLSSHPDGVWFVDLSPLKESSRVAEAIAATLAVGTEPEKGLLETLVHHVSEKRLLLVLDNCEHQLEACAAIADALLRTAADVRVLATSRESLGVEGERVFSLPSLAVPSAAWTSLDVVKASEAVRLFVDRAQTVNREFVLDAQSAPPVVEICRRLDGIPLAIELAAARAKMLSVEEIRSRLDNRFRLLTGGHKTLRRHQTLRAAFQWSHDLLTAEEQRLFRLLAVFRGGWTLEAATAVWSDTADEFTVLELMTRLADQSLVVIERLAGETSHYRMLEMSRQFAQEKLDEAGEGDAARARHLKYFVAWLEHHHAMAGGAEQGNWLAQVEQEHENVLCALEFCPRAEGGPEQALRLTHELFPYWSLRGLYGVGRDRLDAALQLSGVESPTPERAWALNSMGELARRQGALAESQKYYEESLTLSRNFGDTRNIALTLNGLGVLKVFQNDPTAARSCFEEALHLGREFGASRLIGLGLNHLAILASDCGDLAQARELWEESLNVARNLMDPWHLAMVLSSLTEATLRSGLLEEARGNLMEVLRIVRDQGLRPLAESALRRSCELAAAMDDSKRAARWSGTAAALQTAIGSRQQRERERANHAAIMERVRETLGVTEFARVAAEGAALDFEEALAEAQAWLEDPERWA